MASSDNTSLRRRLGDFEIGREIGRGGMGIVYEARQVSLNRKVALKVLAGSLGLTSKAVVRFRREAEAAAKLHHTNIVPIYATGEHEGTHFYAMELVEGPSLNLVIRQMRAEPRLEARADVRAPIEPQESSSAETQSTVTIPLPPWVAQTIAGEVTPAHPGASGSAVGDSSTTLTAGGGYFDNTARLIAEVADGLDYAHNEGVIHRDIKPSNLLLSPTGRLSVNDFGLARMLEQPGMTMTGEFVGSPLYMSPEQITAGRAPLDHRTDIYSLGATLYELLTLAPPFLGERRDQVIAQIMHKEPKPPRRINAKIPVDLETICLKALEKDPDRRYQTASQMAEDLRRFVNRFAISAKRAGPVARTVKWARRHPAVAALVGIVVIVSAVACILAYRSHLADERAQLAEEATRQEAGQHALDQALLEVFSGRWDHVEPWLEEAEIADVDPGRLRVLRGLVALQRGNTETAIHHLELAVEQLPDNLGANALLLYAYMEVGRYDGILPLAQRIPNLTPVTPEDHLYGALQVGWFWPERARKWLEDLAAERPTPVVHLMLAHRRLADLRASGDPTDIEKVLSSAGAAKTQMPRSMSAAQVHYDAHLTAADLYQLREDAVHRDFHLEQAQKDARFLLGHHGDDEMPHRMSAELAAYQGRWDDALTHIRNAASRSNYFPRGRPGLPLLLCRVGRYEEALAGLDALPPRYRGHPQWCRDRAVIAGAVQGLEAAKAIYQTWMDEHDVFPCQKRFSLRYLPFEIYCLLGQYEDAIRFSREYLEVIAPPVRERRFISAFQQYICGELSDGELIAAASNRLERADAYYLIGLKHLAQSDRTAAVEYFTKIEQAGRLLLMRFPWAELFLDRMHENPRWPPWIPVKEETTSPPAVEPTGTEP